MEPSTYSPLSHENREIRIVTIVPSLEPSLPIRCTTCKASLNSSPYYLALSYAWGDPTPIFLDDIEIQVTTNLEAALRHIRAPSELPCWVDAICINQSDPVERGQQVQLMRDIYSEATEVIVWLGEEQDDSRLAVGAVERLVWDHLMGGLNYRPTLDALNRLQDTVESEAIRRLFERSWWYRLWTVQEVVLAKEIRVVCGKKSAPWRLFLDWSHNNARVDPSVWPARTSDFRDIIFCPGSSGVFAKANLRMSYEKHRSIEFTLMDILGGACNGMKCTDQRDRIYGVLGLAKDSGDFDPPDYTLSVSTLYVRVASIMVEQYQDLRILHHALRRSPLATQYEGLPSWVPDWLPRDYYPRSLSIEAYSAAKGGEALAYVVDSPVPILFAQGVVWDNITDLEVLDSFGKENPNWERLIYTGQNRTYPTGIPQLQAYFRSILLDEDILTKARLSLANESFFRFAAAFIAYLYTFSYPPLRNYRHGSNIWRLFRRIVRTRSGSIFFWRCR
jgi:hypothetical protein